MSFLQEGLGEGRSEVDLGGGEMNGPADEIEALRAILFAELRRRPGDTASLTRRAEALARIMAAAKRLSPAKRIELEQNLKLVLENVERAMKPENHNE